MEPFIINKARTAVHERMDREGTVLIGPNGELSIGGVRLDPDEANFVVKEAIVRTAELLQREMDERVAELVTPVREQPPWDRKGPSLFEGLRDIHRARQAGTGGV